MRRDVAVLFVNRGVLPVLRVDVDVVPAHHHDWGVVVAEDVHGDTVAQLQLRSNR